MKKIVTATALIVALSISGLALAAGPKVGDKLNLCEKQGAYTLLSAKDKCDGKKVDGSLKAIKDGKMEVDVKGKKVLIDQPKAVESKAPLTKAAPVKAPETKAAPEKTMTPAAPDKK
jgi:hypothetical protein